MIIKRHLIPSAKGQDLQLIRRMLGFLKPVRRTALIACIIIIARVLMEVVSVYFLSPAITAISRAFLSAGNESDPTFWNWLTRTPSGSHLLSVLAWMAAAQIGLGAFTYLRNLWDTKFSMEAVFHIRHAVYDKLQHVEFAFHDRMSSGQLINRALSDLQSVRAFVNMSTLTTLDVFVSVTAYLALLWFRSPWLALAAMAPIPIWSVVILRFTRKARPLYRAQQEASDRLMNALTENISGVHVVRAFGTQELEKRKYHKLSKRLLARMFKVIRLQAHLTPTLKWIATTSHVALFILTAWLISKERLHVGDLMIVGAAMGNILSKLQQINSMTEIYQNALVSGRRLFEILDAPVAKSETPRSRDTSGDILFRDVSFAYDPRKPVLKRTNIRIDANRITAIVGTTGSGKSTLAGLVARFYDPQSGSIEIDGIDLRKMDLHLLRRTVGYVFQETFLFTDTLKNNIRYGRTDVSDEMVLEAARAAHADEFIQPLPQGYDTLYGEKGVMLSGGQKQRLALARALVYDPKILVLDDATASLDAKTEQSVYRMLEPLFKERTVLMISSRIATVKKADFILVMDQGEIVQSGTHAELMAKAGLYRDLAQMQLRKPTLEPRPMGISP